MTHDKYSIIYDLDGTLVDTAPDLVHTLNATLKKFEFNPVSHDDVGELIGNGAKAMLERAFKLLGKPQEPEFVSFMFDEFLNYYIDNLTRAGSTPYPHVEKVLTAFEGAGALQGVCTNKFQTGAEGVLRELNLARYFPAIVGGDALSVRKPDPMHITETIRRLGGSKEKAIMVGDSKNDAAAAQAAGIPVILVTYGYTSIPVTEMGADIIIDSFDELPGAIKAVTGHSLLD